ncbi:MAG TPA: alpha/beta fold hydrolase [Solirubrobacteraceae bacterium]|nr:alpha/beta fold hydrolase [Solirubrobacteraceae bacterium]
MTFTFTASHRGGSGSPMVCLHGFSDTWRSWELVLPALERQHEVLALTLPGHAGGPPLGPELSDDTLVDHVERSIDAAGMHDAHIVGNSLGAYVALRLAARGRARSVVAFAPAGGWADGDPWPRELLRLQLRVLEQAEAVAPHADAIAASSDGRRRATELITTNFEHIPAGLIAHQTIGVARAPEARRILEYGHRARWSLDAERIGCPVRVVWGTADRLLPWPQSAVRYRTQLLPHADWIELDGIGHCPQLDTPLETAQLILGFTK